MDSNSWDAESVQGLSIQDLCRPYTLHDMTQFATELAQGLYGLCSILWDTYVSAVLQVLKDTVPFLNETLYLQLLVAIKIEHINMSNMHNNIFGKKIFQYEFAAKYEILFTI